MAFFFEQGLSDLAALGKGVVHGDEVGEADVLDSHCHMKLWLEGAEFEGFDLGDVQVVEWLDVIQELTRSP